MTFFLVVVAVGDMPMGLFLLFWTDFPFKDGNLGPSSRQDFWDVILKRDSITDFTESTSKGGHRNIQWHSRLAISNISTCSTWFRMIILRIFGGLAWDPCLRTCSWEPCLETLFLGPFRTLAWEPLPGTLSKPCLGTLLGNLACEPCLRTLLANLAKEPVGTLSWKPCLGTCSW